MCVCVCQGDELLCRPPDPFGEDPFKGSDPFAADAFFAQPGEDPFAGSGAGPAEPDPFGASLNNAAGAPATAPDPFATNLSGASTSNDLFGTAAAAAAAATGSVDLFGSQGNGHADPFSSSQPAVELPVVSELDVVVSVQCSWGTRI